MAVERDERLERISDLIRSGTPVGFWEAIEVIEYQEALRAERDEIRRNVWWRRLIRKITGRKEPK